MFKTLYKLLAAAPFLCLAACGGSSNNDGNGQLRLANVTSNYASLDLYENGSLLSSGVAQGATSSYVSVWSGTNTFSLNPTGSAVTMLSISRTTAKDTAYTLLAYTTAGSLHTVLLGDNSTAPPSGTGYLRIYNASIEAGNVDIYVTNAGSSISGITPLASSINSEHFSVYSQFGAGAYHVVVTGASNPTDVRLDLPSVSLVDQQIATLVLTSTPGGALVNAALLNQGGNATLLANASARVRLVADVTGGTSVSATANGTALSANGAFTSPVVGPYNLVPAGALTATVLVGGAPVQPAGLTLAAGSDSTLLVYGSLASPQIKLINDDNSPPLLAGTAKIRVVHGLNDLNGNINLVANGFEAATNVAIGTASTPAVVTATTSSASSLYTLDVTSPVTGATALFEATTTTLPGASIWTIWMLGDNPASRVGTALRDR